MPEEWAQESVTKCPWKQLKAARGRRPFYGLFAWFDYVESGIGCIEDESVRNCMNVRWELLREDVMKSFRRDEDRDMIREAKVDEERPVMGDPKKCVDLSDLIRETARELAGKKFSDIFSDLLRGRVGIYANRPEDQPTDRE